MISLVLLILLVVVGFILLKSAIGLLIMLVTAFICGVVAEKVVGSGPGGILGSIVVGFIGGLIGNIILPGMRYGIMNLIASIIGAIIFLAIWKAFAGSKKSA